jgi:hypothetical protein
MSVAPGAGPACDAAAAAQRYLRAPKKLKATLATMPGGLDDG